MYTEEIAAIVYNSVMPRSKLIKAFNLTLDEFAQIKNDGVVNYGRIYDEALDKLLKKSYFELRQVYHKLPTRTIENILANIPQRYPKPREHDLTLLSTFIIRASHLSDEALAWMLHWPPIYINDVRNYNDNYFPEVRPNVAWFHQFTKEEYDNFFDFLHEDDAGFLCETLSLRFPYKPKYTCDSILWPKEKLGTIVPSKITIMELSEF